jgi:hypothetical protein
MGILKITQIMIYLKSIYMNSNQIHKYFKLKTYDLDFNTSVMSLFGAREGAVRGSSSALRTGLPSTEVS